MPWHAILHRTFKLHACRWRMPSPTATAAATAAATRTTTATHCPTPGGTAQNLLKIAALEAFWAIDKVTLDRLAKHRDVDLPKGSSLFQTIFYLIRSVLEDKTEEEILLICSARLARIEPHAWSDEILQVDEAVQCLDKHDEKEFKREQQNASTAKELSSSFSKEYAAKHAELRARAVEAKGKKPGRKPKQASTSSSSSSSKPTTLPQQIPMEEAKLFVPPGGLIWPDRKIGAWRAQFPPFSGISRSWGHHGGEHEALKLCIIYLWSKWCEVNGVPHAECPMKGVL
jgi:hypothetical protein